MDRKKLKERFFEAMEKGGSDAYWVVKPQNVRYLTGFHGEDSTVAALGGKYYLLTDRRYAEEAEKKAYVDDIILRDGSMAETAGAVVKKNGAEKPVISAANVSCDEYKMFSDAAGGVRVAMRKHGIAEYFRRCKNPDEIELIKRCIRISERSLQKLVNGISTGESEKMMAAELEYIMRGEGAERAAFDTICAVGDHAAMPHARTSERHLSEHETLLVDWGCTLDGYNSDLTRMLYHTTMQENVRKLCDILLQAQDAALGVIKPGARLCEIDSAARDVINAAGYGDYFSHGLGHGVGLEVHEYPSVSPRCQDQLKPGMVFTVEPGIYIKAQIGVRIEEIVCVTDTGCVKLSSLKRVPMGINTI